MKIVVCIKQVPDTKGGVKFNPDGTLDRGAMLAIMNPDDKAGLEAALRLKDQYGAEVTVLTMGLPKATDVLREAIAMGADKGVLVTDRVLGGADTWATSTTIAGALRNLEYDLVITGRLKIDGEFVSPEEFIPVLESNGLVVDLDHMILRQVCEYLCGRRDRGESLFPISVNLSSIHLSIPNSSEKLSEMIREYDLPNELFCFEITEYNVIQSFARAANYNRTQQACGFKTSVDDFGSGYTGLNIIRKIPISEVKLDKSFLDDSGDAHTAFRNRSILSAIYRLTQDLGIKVVCEGVETEEQRKMLVDIGYRFGQGFYFHRPCDPEKLRIS